MKKVHFIDCGANVGNAISWAQENYKERLIKVDAFEPEYLNFTLLLNKFLDNNSFDLKVHAQAVWIKNEIKKFHIQPWGTRTGSSLQSDKEHTIGKGQIVPYMYKGREVGISFLEEHAIRTDVGHVATQDLSVFYTEGSPEFVQCLDISEWLFKNLSKDNYNVLKIDIEGSEYKVIDHLLNTGAHELIDEWLVEFTCKKRVPESYDQDVIDRFESIVSNYVDWGDTSHTVMGGTNG